MTYRERLWTFPRGLISGPQFLLVLNFLYKNKVRNVIYRKVSKGEFSHILGCQCKKPPPPPKSLKTNQPTPPKHKPSHPSIVFLGLLLGSCLFIIHNRSLNMNWHYSSLVRERMFFFLIFISMTLTTIMQHSFGGQGEATATHIFAPQGFYKNWFNSMNAWM